MSFSQKVLNATGPFTSTLKNITHLNNGIYIDVGCNHPIKFNNTYLLYKRGWSGINIDLDSKSICFMCQQKMH